jgi:MYXO-CTERM domain-containing protein
VAEGTDPTDPTNGAGADGAEGSDGADGSGSGDGGADGGDKESGCATAPASSALGGLWLGLAALLGLRRRR